MIDVIVFDESDITIGIYKSDICPRQGEKIAASNGLWIIEKVCHDIRGSLLSDRNEPPIQTTVLVTVVKCVT